MPPFEFPGDFSWGYNPSLPFAVAAPYGTVEELQQLVEAAHAHGIGVLIDVVHNHYSSRTPLFSDTSASLNFSRASADRRAFSRSGASAL